MGAVTSCQQFELYGAERACTLGNSFIREEDLQKWVDGLRENPWWERFYPQVVRVEAYFRPQGDSSVGAWKPEDNAGIIEMLPPHRNELYVLHELAHVLAAARYQSKAHCPWFARVYLELVHLVMGNDHFNELLAAFDAAGIRHDPPKQDFEIGSTRFQL